VFWLPLRWLGVLFSVAAGAVSLWAVHSLGRSFMPKTVVVPDQVLITSGPYRVVRHPAYFGELALWVGAGLGTGNWLLLGYGPWPCLASTARLAKRRSSWRSSSETLSSIT